MTPKVALLYFGPLGVEVGTIGNLWFIIAKARSINCRHVLDGNELWFFKALQAGN